MRSPNQAAIKEECLKVIPALLEKWGISQSRQITVDSTGWVNPCFFIDDRFVVRFNARDPLLPKFQREKFVYDLLKNGDVPVPQQVWLDESKEISRFDVLISQRVPGNPIEPAWPEMSQAQRNKLASQAGTLFAHLHSHKFNFFGEFSKQSPFPKTSTWPACLQAKLHYHLNEARTLGIFNTEEEALFTNALQSNAENLKVETASLLHGDYHFGNMLYVGDRITGILDFEWSMAGDPLFDLCRWVFPDAEEWAAGREALFAAYGKNSFTTLEELRLHIYQMIHNVELTVVSKLHFDDSEFRSFREITLNQVRRT